MHQRSSVSKDMIKARSEQQRQRRFVARLCVSIETLIRRSTAQEQRVRLENPLPISQDLVVHYVWQLSCGVSLEDLAIDTTDQADAHVASSSHGQSNPQESEDGSCQ